MFGIIAGITSVIVSAKEKVEAPSASLIILGGNKQQTLASFSDDARTKKIIRQSEIEHEAKLLEKQGRYEDAVTKYQEAMHPSLLNSERDKAGAIGGILRIHQKQGKFDLALKELGWFSAYPNQLYVDTKPELEALIKARDTDSMKPIYAHISHLKEKHQKFIPPKGHEPVFTTNIIRLYDYIGDLDAGIAFVDAVIAYKKLTFSTREEYLKIKQAFTEDKAKGSKGRATEALIRSDYFPW